MNQPKIQWHPAFYSAIQLELMKNKDQLNYFNEYTLNTKPLLMDVLIIRKSSDIPIANEIGRIFRKHNILEYKSPDDEMGIDTYFKTLAYACLYKTTGTTVNSIKAEDITITMIRDSMPRKLMKYFHKKNYEVSNPYAGIYYIQKDGFFPTQLIVSQKLALHQHQWLRALTKQISKDTARQLLYSIDRLSGKSEREAADSVFTVSYRANKECYEDLQKEGSNMYEALMELFKPNIDETVRKAVDAQVKAELDTRVEAEFNAMLEAEVNTRFKAELNSRVNAELDSRVNAELDSRVNAAVTKAVNTNTRTTIAQERVKHVARTMQFFHATLEQACKAAGCTVAEYEESVKLVGELK